MGNKRELQYTDVWFCFGTDNMLTGMRTRVGKLPHARVNDYMNNLRNFVSPKGRCMQYHFFFVLHSHPKPVSKDGLNQSLYIVVTNPYYINYLCGAKNEQECMCNIKCGKCVDPFVRECIGKKFWSLEYIRANNYITNDKQKE